MAGREVCGRRYPSEVVAGAPQGPVALVSRQLCCCGVTVASGCGGRPWGDAGQSWCKRGKQQQRGWDGAPLGCVDLADVTSRRRAFTFHRLLRRARH